VVGEQESGVFLSSPSTLFMKAVNRCELQITWNA